ncbi:MAG: glycosyltransferase [Candidatus Altiarchaeales archaeon]|nr:glycosyltransferase [Candidatus Altiarchaeales archaeon]MBD3415581.1 glycosyltransferase [Candidatus Altiarchaeales archaeon]
MYRDKSLAVVVPAYNEQDLISTTLTRIPDYVDRIFLVDDGSTDGTVDEAEKLNLPNLTIISHEGNQGVGSAILSGYRASLDSGYELVVVMAGDNQMDPIQLSKLLDPLVDGKADYAKGNRLMSTKARSNMPLLRLFGNSILTLLTKVSSGYWDIMDPQNGFTALTSDVLETLPLDTIYPRYGYPNDMLIKMNTYNLRVIDVVMPPIYGEEKSKIRLWNYIPSVSWLLFRGFFWRLKEKYVLKALHPLVFFYFLGLTLLPLGILTGFYMLFVRIKVGAITASSAFLPMFLIITGLQSLFFAMLFDMESARK